MSPSNASLINLAHDDESPLRRLSSAEHAFSPQNSCDGRQTLPLLQASGYNDEDINRKLFHSDERAYLLEEIERKDNMLSMLTEGLREVRTHSYVRFYLRMCFHHVVYDSSCVWISTFDCHSCAISSLFYLFIFFIFFLFMLSFLYYFLSFAFVVCIVLCERSVHTVLVDKRMILGIEQCYTLIC